MVRSNPQILKMLFQIFLGVFIVQPQSVSDDEGQDVNSESRGASKELECHGTFFPAIVEICDYRISKIHIKSAFDCRA